MTHGTFFRDDLGNGRRNPAFHRGAVNRRRRGDQVFGAHPTVVLWCDGQGGEREYGNYPIKHHQEEWAPLGGEPNVRSPLRFV